MSVAQKGSKAENDSSIKQSQVSFLQDSIPAPGCPRAGTKEAVRRWRFRRQKQEEIAVLVAPLQSSPCVSNAQHQFSLLAPWLWEEELGICTLGAVLRDTREAVRRWSFRWQSEGRSSVCVGDACERNTAGFVCLGRGFAMLRLCNIGDGAKLLKERNEGFEIPWS